VATLLSVKLDQTLRFNRQNAFQGGLEWVSVGYEGQSNTAVSYFLLNALHPGNNVIWKLSLQRDLLEGLQLMILYNGRTGMNKIIHTGQLRLNAFF